MPSPRLDCNGFYEVKKTCSAPTGTKAAATTYNPIIIYYASCFLINVIS